MSLVSDIFGEMLDDSHFSLDFCVMDKVCDDIMSATTPPYDGSEREDVQLFDRLLSESAFPPSDSLASLFTPVSPSPSQTFDENSDAGSDVTASSLNRVSDNPSGAYQAENGSKKVSDNKGAIAARQNRTKRKMYVEGLENSVSKLRKENNNYKLKIDALQKAVNSLSEDATYLKGVLQNQSDLAKILKAISTVPGITVDPSIQCISRKSLPAERIQPSDAEEPVTKSRKQDSDYGICLNVQNGSVSFELCSHCNNLSSSNCAPTSKDN